MENVRIATTVQCRAVILRRRRGRRRWRRSRACRQAVGIPTLVAATLIVDLPLLLAGMALGGILCFGRILFLDGEFVRVEVF